MESSDLMEDFTHKEMIRAAAVLWPVGNRTNLRVPHPLRSLQRVGYATVSIEIRDFPSEVKA